MMIKDGMKLGLGIMITYFLVSFAMNLVGWVAWVAGSATGAR